MAPSEIENINDLSNYLRCRESDIIKIIEEDIYVIDNKDDKIKSEKWYYELIRDETKNKIVIQKMYIPKKRSSSHRVVYSIKNNLYSGILKTLNSYLNKLYLPEENIHGFIQYRGIKTNASHHLGKKMLLAIDIDDFFESISIKSIICSFEKLDFKKDISLILSKLVTYKGTLVKGFNTSPIIANMICQEMDKELSNLCTGDIVYTRYADDLYFSSNISLPNLKTIESILNKYGFILNHKKTKLMKKGRQQYVTGLTVFDKNCPRISKTIKRNLRLEIYHINKWGMLNHTLKQLKYSEEEYLTSNFIRYNVDEKIYKNYNRINGWIQFIRSIEPEYGNKLLGEMRNHKLLKNN